MTSGTWKGLSPEARADLHASEYLRLRAAPNDEPSGLESVQELFAVSFDDRQIGAVRALCVASFVAGTEREGALEMGLEAERKLRLRYERALLERGIALPKITE